MSQNAVSLSTTSADVHGITTLSDLARRPFDVPRDTRMAMAMLIAVGVLIALGVPVASADLGLNLSLCFLLEAPSFTDLYRMVSGEVRVRVWRSRGATLRGSG